jgi:hypothetical protein
MSLQDLLPELLKLNREEKVQAIEILKQQITDDVPQFVEGVGYEVWSPYNSPETAFELLQMIKEDEEQRE